MRATAGLLILLFSTGPILAQNQAEESTVSYLSSVTVAKGSTAEEMICILCSAEIQGRVTGDVVLIGGNADISGSVGGDVIVVGGRIRTRGSIGGEAFALGGEIQRETGAQIKGEAESFPWLHLPGQRSFHPTGVLFLASTSILLVLLAGLIWRRETSDRLADRVARRWWLALLVGAVVWYLYAEYVDEVETTSTVLEVIFWVVLVLVLVATWFGFYGMAWAVGRRLRRPGGWMTRLAGGLIFAAALLVPVLGLAVFCLIFVIGLGAGLLFTWPAMRRRSEGKAVLNGTA